MRPRSRTAIFRRRASPIPNRIVLVPRLLAIIISDNAIDLEWEFTDRAGADEIVIERSDNLGQTWSVLTTQPANGSGTYRDSTLSANVCYYYRAYGVINFSAFSILSVYSKTQIRTTTDTFPALVKPVGLATVVTSLGNTEQVNTFLWSQVPNADGYYWWITSPSSGGFTYRSEDDPELAIGLTTTSATGIQIPRPTGDRVSVLNVAPVNASGRGPTAIFPFVISGNLKAPALLTPEVNGNDVSISWVANPFSTSETLYRLERDNGDGFAQVGEDIPVGTPAPQYIDLDLDDDNYDYRVVAVDASVIDPINLTPIERYSDYSAVETASVNTAGEVTPDGGQNFEEMNDAGNFDLNQFRNATENNLIFDDGSITANNQRGMLYRFIQRDLHCGDQALFINAPTAPQREVWWKQVIVFGPEFTTLNENCSIIPNYKLLIGHILPGNSVVTGRPRFEITIGHGLEGRNIGITGTGYPDLISGEQVDTTAFITPVPIDATTLFNLTRIVFLGYWTTFLDPLDGAWKETMMLSVNGQLIRAWTDFSGNPGTAQFNRFQIGGSKSVGAIVQMHYWLKEFWWWNAGNNPRFFNGVVPTDYT